MMQAGSAAPEPARAARENRLESGQWPGKPICMSVKLAQTDDETLAVYRQALADNIERGDLKLPLLPQVVGEVLALTSNPDVDIREFAALIHRDQALAGHVLRIANSAAFGGGEIIVSLQQAITRLGLKLLSEITVAVSLKGEIFCAPEFSREAKRIWRHALASGAYGKEAARMKRTNVEGQFLCGLLHTMGQPVLLKAIADLNAAQPPGLAAGGAWQLTEELHGRVGEYLAETWKLPQQVRVCCAHYRNYAAAPAFREETAMTYLADRLACWLAQPDGGKPADLLEDPVFEFLNFYPDEIQALLDRQEDVLATVNAMDL
jgi:HD-like signal output (HDOD) protein